MEYLVLALIAAVSACLQYGFIRLVFLACEAVDDFDERVSAATGVCSCAMAAVGAAVWFPSLPGSALLFGLLAGAGAFLRQWALERKKPLTYVRLFS